MMIDSQLDVTGSILELGSGPGRITHPLVAMGHAVVAVDDSRQALEPEDRSSVRSSSSSSRWK
ncbi:MAG: hypothetical protein WCE80_01845, partial [Acidimicrobiia bacterium]